MRKKSRRNTIWFTIIGFVFGLLIVLIATIIAVMAAGQQITLDNLIRAQLITPLLWVIDWFPFILAAALWFAGSAEDRSTWVDDDKRALQRQVNELKNTNTELTRQGEERQELENLITRAKQQWETTVDSVDEIILVTAANGDVVRCNRATVEALNVSFGEILGRPVENLFFGETPGSEVHLPEQKTEMKFPKLEGWYEVSSSPWVLEGAQQGKIFIIRNITEGKEARLDVQRQKQFYESLVQNSPIAIITTDLNQRAVTVNPAFEKMFGYSGQEIISRDLDSLISPSSRLQEARDFTEKVKRGEMVHSIAKRQRKDGSEVDVELFGVPVILWGKQIGMLGLYHDVSELVHQQQEAEQRARRAEADAAAAVAAAAFVAMKAPEKVQAEEAPIIIPSEEAPEISPAEEAPEILPTEEAPETLPVEETPEIVPPPVEAEPEKRPPVRKIKIETIEGIGPVYAEKLGELGITTTQELLAAGATRKGREDLVEKTGLSMKLILKWVNRADLMRVPGIGEEYSDLLEVAGVDTVKELRNRIPENLHQAMLTINEEKHLVRRTPHLSEVQAWVQAAKGLEPVMTY